MTYHYYFNNELVVTDEDPFAWMDPEIRKTHEEIVTSIEKQWRSPEIQAIVAMVEGAMAQTWGQP